MYSKQSYGIYPGTQNFAPQMGGFANDVKQQHIILYNYG